MSKIPIKYWVFARGGKQLTSPGNDVKFCFIPFFARGVLRHCFVAA